MKIDISTNKLAELYSRGYNGDIILLLLALNDNEDIPDQIQFSKTEAKCVRKGLIFNNKLTKTGLELLEWLDKPEDTIFEKKKLNDDVFNLWWESYPSSDNFTYRGRSFKGGRGLKVKKDDCKIKLKAILDEDEHSIEDLVRALNYEVTQKMEKSYKEGKNIMSFMQNSLTYLTQRTYENFIEISNEKANEPKIFNGVDI